MSKRRRFRLDDLSASHQEHARAQIAGSVDPGLLLDGIGPDETLRRAALELDAPAASVRSPHTGKGAKRGMSKLELRFQNYLAQMKAQGVVLGYAYELARVPLGVPRATKKPDFWVRCDGWRIDDEDGAFPLVVIEVKPKDGDTGRPYFGPKGRLSVKLAAQRLALVMVPLYVAWPYMEDWRFERVAVRS